jgi:DNA-binding SARP family transcriptional activator
MAAVHARITPVSPGRKALQLKTFGGLSIVAHAGSAPVGAAGQRRRLALLAVLAAA